MFIAPILTSLAWFSDGAGVVEITAPTEVTVVRAAGDPRPRVGAMVEGRRVDAVLGLREGHSTMGRLLAIRLGLAPRRAGRDRVVVPEVTVGALTLRDLRVELVDGEELVLGLGALPEVAVALRASAGTATFVRDGDAAGLLAEVGPLRVAPAPWRTAVARSVAAGEPTAWRGGRRVVWAVPSLGDAALSGLWARSSDDTVWGADALVEVDLAVRPRTGEWSARRAEDLGWLDPRPGALAALEVRASAWELPEEAEGDHSLLAGDPGSSWRSDRFLELSRARWAMGQRDEAVAASVASVGWGADRCEPWVTLGEQLLRGGTASGAVRGIEMRSVEVLRHARGLLLAWTEQPVATRGATFSVRQPSTCERVHGLLAEALDAADDFEALAQLEHPDAWEVRAARALREGDPASASRWLRQAMARQPGPDSTRDALLTLAEARSGHALPARAGLCPTQPVGLAEAVWLWEAAERLDTSPSCPAPWPAQQVVARLAGEAGRIDEPSVWSARHPQASWVEGPFALASELGWVGWRVATAPSSDRAMGAVLSAQAHTRPEALRSSLVALRQQWPRFAVGNGRLPSRVSYSAPSRTEDP